MPVDLGRVAYEAQCLELGYMPSAWGDLNQYKRDSWNAVVAAVIEAAQRAELAGPAYPERATTNGSE